jgi:anti-sigma factor RsiW
MTMRQGTCDPTLLGRFLDQELGPEERDQLTSHLEDCLSCQRALQDQEAISTIFRTSLEAKIPNRQLVDLEARVLTRIRGSHVSWWVKLKERLGSKKFYIPAAAAAAAMAIFVYSTKPTAPPPGPSAVINSFTGEITSVMILETPRSRQTILWFHETSAPEEEENGMQEA